MFGKRRRLKQIANFRATVKKHGLPVIVLTNNDKQFNFILDTGASQSVLTTRALQEMEYTILGQGQKIYGVDGNKVDTLTIKAKLHVGDKLFIETFNVMDVPAFDTIREEDHIEVTGILGNSFFQKYECLIDFHKSGLGSYKQEK